MIGSINLDLSIDYFRSNVFELKDDEALSSLLNFCLNFELDKEEVDYWSLKTIQIYGKEDLFKRFCRDVFLCLQRLQEKDELDMTYEFILEHYTNHQDIALIYRERELNNLDKSPDFNKKVL